MIHQPSRPILISLCGLFLSGCSWMPWIGKKESVRFGIISVQLNTPAPKGKRITYAVASVHKGRKLKDAGFQRLGKDGSASFVLPMDQLYDVRIFCDNNHNQSMDAGEPNGLVQNIAPVPSTAAVTGPVTLAFGVLGPVAGHARPKPTTAPSTSTDVPAIPAEVEPYLQYIPRWLQDKLLR